MTTDQNTDLIRRWLQMADAGFAGNFDDFFTSDYSGHLSGRIHMDLAELQHLERGFAAAFSEVRRTVEDLWGDDDKVILRITTRAKHCGEFNGIPATGRAVVFSGMVIYQIRDGRIAESWGELDFAGLWRQLNEAQPTGDAQQKFKPDGWPTVTPRIVVSDVRGLVKFVQDVFGAGGDYRADVPTVMHIGDSTIMISDAGFRDPAPAFLYVYVANADETYGRAIRAGARSLEEPSDLPYGDRRGMVQDKWGNTWQIATRLRGSA